MTHEDYVTFEQAQQLKQLGFDLECNHYYHLYDELPTLSVLSEYENSNKFDKNWSAPTLAQAQKWLREKGIEVGAFADFDGELPNGKWMWLMRKFNTHLYDTEFTEENINYNSYEEALSEGINKALKILKEQENG